MKKNSFWVFTIITCLLILILLVCLLLLTRNRSSDISPPSTANEITIKKLENHNTLETCWFAYSGRVFDISRLLVQKPDQVNNFVSLCGKNINTLPEGFKKASDLTQYQIGILTP